MPELESKRLVIYDTRTRWVAAINLAFAAIGIYLSLRFVHGALCYFLVVFLSLFALFWIRDAAFGFPLKLLTDANTLHWQDGKQTGSAPLNQIQSISIGVERSVNEMALEWPHIVLQMANGQKHTLPPNLANGLRARNWRHLKRLIAHIQAISPVSVIPLHDPTRNIQGVADELLAAPKATRPLP